MAIKRHHNLAKSHSNVSALAPRKGRLGQPSGLRQGKRRTMEGTPVDESVPEGEHEGEEAAAEEQGYGQRCSSWHAAYEQAERGRGAQCG